MPRRFSLLFFLLVGCGLRVDLIETSAKKPSNVAMYFTVDTLSGEPVPNLTEQDFRIYEDGELISIFESKQTILNPEIASEHFTMLLLDLSGSVTESGQLPTLVRASTAFVDRVTGLQKVAVYGFDGRNELQKFTDFSNNPEAVKSQLGALEDYRGKDPSTNLNGAIVAAINELQKRRDKSSAPLAFGTLVVFTDGKDRAKRVTEGELRDALYATDIDIFVVGLGGEIDRGGLRKIGRSGVYFAEEESVLVDAFERVAARIEAMSKRYYLLSYCSPARAGEHELQVEAISQGRRGRAKYIFRADGFTPDCDPKTPPSFDIKRGGRPRK